MAISDWTLAGIAFALTLLTCAAMRALIGGGRWTVVACLGAGVVVTPAVVFLGFHAADGVVGGRNSQLVFLFAWIAGIGASALFARAAHVRHGVRGSPKSRP